MHGTCSVDHPRRPGRFAALRSSLSFGIAAILLLAGQAVYADQESCNQCKFLRCLKSTVEHKRQLIAVYQGLFNFWHGRTTDAAGKALMVIDRNTFPNANWADLFRANSQQMQEYAVMEKSRTETIPGPEGCAYTGEELTAGTTVLTCETTGLVELRAAQPCSELADFLTQHEGLHQQRCEVRRNASPQKLLTPAGKAQEEIEAYQLEISQLQPIIDRLEKKCRKVSFSGVTIDCKVHTPRCTMRTGQTISGSVCGDPTTATWTITPHYFAEGCGIPAIGNRGDKPFQNDCVPAGSDIEKKRAAVYQSARGSGVGGWMCVYTDGDKPKITIRSFRPSMCEGGSEQTITVDAQVSDRCDEEAPQPQPPIPDRPNS